MQRDVIGNPPVSRGGLQAAGPRRALLSADRDWRALGKVSGVRNQVNTIASQYIIGLARYKESIWATKGHSLGPKPIISQATTAGQGFRRSQLGEHSVAVVCEACGMSEQKDVYSEWSTGKQNKKCSL